MPVSQVELTRMQDVENVTMLASAQEDAEGLVRKVAVLKGELAKVHRAREVPKEKFHSLSNVSTDGARWLVVSEMEHWEQFEDLSLLWAWGVELCLTIIGPSQVNCPLLVRMRATALRHAGVVGELTSLQEAIYSTVELVLGHPPYETSQVEVMNELAANF
jgi:hypothetical protein